MGRRFNGHMSGERYCADAATEEIHDLDFEQADCHIDQIIHAGNDIPVESLDHAHAEGYENCRWCLGGAHKSARGVSQKAVI